MSEWVNLDARWPEYDTPVLVWVNAPERELAIAAYSDDDGWVMLSTTRSGLAAQVTHWMPLPEPPTETEV